MIIPKFIGHRGWTGYQIIPENTPSAVEFAHRHGLKAVHFDVQMTMDKKFVIYGRNLLETATDGKGFVFNNIYDKIIKMRLNYILCNKEYMVCSLDEMMQRVNDLNMFANIQIKTYSDRPEYSYDSLYLLVRHMLKNYSHRMPKILFSTFNPTIIRLLDDFRTEHGINYAPIDYFPLSGIIPSALIYNLTFVDPSKLYHFKEMKYPIILHNIINKSQSDRLFKLGINSVIIDRI